MGPSPFPVRCALATSIEAHHEVLASSQCLHTCGKLRRWDACVDARCKALRCDEQVDRLHGRRSSERFLSHRSPTALSCTVVRGRLFHWNLNQRTTTRREGRLSESSTCDYWLMGAVGSLRRAAGCLASERLWVAGVFADRCRKQRQRIETYQVSRQFRQIEDRALLG